MILRKHILIAAATAAVIASASCSKKEAETTEQNEETRAEIEAAMMQGRTAAREFVNKEWTDTLELMNHLLKAKAQQSTYVINKHPKSAEAFDSAFISTVRSVDPQLAATITSRADVTAAVSASNTEE